MIDDALVARAEAWMADDPDPATRAEVAALLHARDRAGLVARFDGRLQFGTAGLRGPLGAGPLRMNRAIVRRAAAGIGRWLLEHSPGSAERGVVIGYDARHGSVDFAADSAAVLAGLGLRALLLPGPLPTPILASAILEVGAAAGIMVTASHNPPRDNGYKVYLGDASQIIPPADAEISAAIDAVGSLAAVALAPEGDARIARLSAAAVVGPYLDRVPAVRLVPAVSDVRIAYTALHGVGGPVALAALERAGFPPAVVVAEQFDPDPDFPTVTFPNPEEPGALDAVLAVARDHGADLALAHDPDADRLGVAIPSPRASGGWRALQGDEIGWLLADHILGHTTGADRLVVTTLVSSTLLGRMAAAAGVHYAETSTGFKWIADAIRARPGTRFVFGYEQALGYLVTDRPRDKDGVTAAVVLAEIAALAKAEGTTIEARLAEIGARFGVHRTAERAVRIEPGHGPEVMARLRAAAPDALAGTAVERVVDYPDVDLVRYELAGGARVQVRPSGTEPKVKVYAEAVGADPDPLAAAAARLLA